MAPLEITGNTQKRFVQDAVLLYLLDPVRGSPTAWSLDGHLHDSDVPRERFLKRKFLDSLALVASTHKNGDKVSAATLEEGAPNGTVIRLASNAGVCDLTLLLLQELISHLNEMAATGKTVLCLKKAVTDVFQVSAENAGLGSCSRSYAWISRKPATTWRSQQNCGQESLASKRFPLV
ncbi:hypothetical protein ACKVV7_011370 [Pyricularia oryzae]